MTAPTVKNQRHVTLRQGSTCIQCLGYILRLGWIARRVGLWSNGSCNVTGRARPPDYSTLGPSSRSAAYLRSGQRRWHQAKFTRFLSVISCVPFASFPFDSVDLSTSLFSLFGRNILIQWDGPRVNGAYRPQIYSFGYSKICRDIVFEHESS
jgi:hypothetical protein